jgi:two-component system, cell cycle response regulator
MKILIAEDDPVSRLALRSFLKKWGDEVIVAKDGEEATRLLLHKDGPKIAILDWMMPGADGVEICRRVRERAVEPYVYILILTSRDSPTDIIAALEAGADDYLAKPFVPAVLKARLLTGRRIARLQQELIEAREVLRAEATHDVLTGLWNRRAILNLLQQEISRAAREGSSLTVALADIDHFKNINDTYGHPAGDEVLREVSRRMQASIRTYDVLGRYGGEEFLLVFPGCKQQKAFGVAERVRKAVSSDVVELSGTEITVTLSMGVSVFNGAEDAAAMISRADETLYQAKGHGRNRVEMFAG